MAEQLATLFTCILSVYLGIGILFGIVFVIKGTKTIDPVALKGSWGFKLAILPASAALWPWLIKRWRSGMQASECNAHHKAAGCGTCGCTKQQEEA